MSPGPQLERLLRKAEADADVLAVMLFGSSARGEAGPGSDIDVCLLLKQAHYSATALSQKRLDYAAADVDVQIFQQLPLYIRHRVLKEGKILFVRDEEALYELAFRTARAFEDFKPIYRAYLAEVARGGS